MIAIVLKEMYQCDGAQVYSLIEDFQKIARIKPDFRNYRIARNDPGLQIADTTVKILIFKSSTRLRYATIPERSGELKQVSGSFKEYQCRYNINEKSDYTELVISLRIRFRFWPIGFVRSLILKPLFRTRLSQELRTLKEQLLHDKSRYSSK